MKKVYFEELFVKPGQYFENHLSIIGNERIIFSSRFGTGKTTFLKHFFSESRQLEAYNGKKKYEAFHLFPVNYPVGSNEDIFKYIKFDLLFDLIVNKKRQISETTLSDFDSIYIQLSQNLDKILRPLFLFAENGKAILTLIEAFEKLNEKIRRKIQDGKKGDSDKINEFVKKVFSDENSIYEGENVITGIIRSLITEQEEGIDADDQQLARVLIIDDLDRIDPAHIFRLFNVFSASFDLDNFLANKFGFDKVIFVCDLNNIRNIFFNSYGANVDFSGYIDKFYSFIPFEFFNLDSVSDILGKILKDISFVEKDSRSEPYYVDYFQGPLIHLLSKLIINGELSLRSLLKFYGEELTLEGTKLKQAAIAGRDIEYSAFAAVQVGLTLVKIFGSLEKFEDSFGRLIHDGNELVNCRQTYWESFFRNSLTFIISCNAQIIKENIYNFTYQAGSVKLMIICETHTRGNYIYLDQFKIRDEGGNIAVTNSLNPAVFLMEIINILRYTKVI